MSYLKVAMQIYLKRGDKTIGGQDFTVNRDGNLTLPQIAVGMINALMETYCNSRGLELDSARQALAEVQAGIASLHFEPAEAEHAN